MKIIYNHPIQGISIIHPSEKWLAGKCDKMPGVKEFTIEELAKKDVPKGLPYKIVEDDYIPTDRSFRNAWEIDNEELTDGVGSDHGAPAPNEEPDGKPL